MNMLAILISLLCAGFVLSRELLFKHSGLRRWKDHKQVPPVARPPLGAFPKPEILVSKSYRCGLERTSAPLRQAEMLYLPRLRKRSPRCRGGTLLSCSPRSAKTANLRSPKHLTTHRPVRSFRLSPPEQNSAMRRFMRCSESWTSESAPSWATPRPRSGRPSPTSTSGPLPDT